MPWYALKFGDNKDAIEKVIPCPGYPTPGVIKLEDGSTYIEDAYGKLTANSYYEWEKELADAREAAEIKKFEEEQVAKKKAKEEPVAEAKRKEEGEKAAEADAAAQGETE